MFSYDFFLKLFKTQDCVVKGEIGRTHCINGLVGCMVFNAIFNSISVYRSGQCTYSCFPGILLTSIPHDILSKPLAAFPDNEITVSSERGMNLSQ